MLTFDEVRAIVAAHYGAPFAGDGVQDDDACLVTQQQVRDDEVRELATVGAVWIVVDRQTVRSTSGCISIISTACSACNPAIHSSTRRSRTPVREGLLVCICFPTRSPTTIVTSTANSRSESSTCSRSAGGDEVRPLGSLHSRRL